MTYEATIRGVGVSMSEEGVGVPAVILEVRDVVIPIFVDGGQARTIERARQGVPAERPMTHDLFADVLEDVGVTLDRVRIDDIEDGTFYAKLDLVVDRTDGDGKIVRDARPSDGIALAVRAGCPILVAVDVIDAAGQPPETLGIEGTGQQPGGPEGFDPDVGSESSDIGEREDPESGGLDDAVDIDFEESDESERDDDPDEDVG